MLKLSPMMEAYGKSLMDELSRGDSLLRRRRGARASTRVTEVEIPIASDLADRVEVLVGIKGVGGPDPGTRNQDVP